MDYPYPSPPSLGHGQAPSALSATEEAVAYVAALSRQRSSSSDTLGPDAKRARSTSPSSAATPVEPVSLQRWLQSVATPPLDREQPHHATISSSSALSHTLSDLESSQAWSYLPPPANPSHSTATRGLGFVDTPNSAESFEYHHQRLAGVQTNFHPTPVATPQHLSFHVHHKDSSTAAAGRPVNLRSTTAPVHPSRSIAELKASVGQEGAHFGSQIECRARGEELRRQLGAGEGVARSSTDPGIKVSGEVLSKDRFVAGLVGASVLAIESIWGPTPAECTAATAMSPDGAVLPLHWFVKEVLRRSRTSCSTLQLALYYLHKSRREIRDIVARADTSRDEYCRLEKQLAAEREAHILGDSYPSPPLSPVSDQDDHSIDPQQRFADLMETQNSPVLCGRRMFLASLIAASKFLQDRNYSNRAWARISGLPVTEINVNERAFLNMMKFQLHLGAHDFQKWTERLAALTTQGAALESAAAAATSSRLGLGLVRSQSEFVVEQPTEDLLRSTRPPISTVGRSHSEAAVSSSAAAIATSRQALASKMNERRLAASASSKPLVATEQQTASPVDSDASSSSSGDESSSSSSASSSSARKVRGMPIRRLAQRPIPQQHGNGIPLVRSGSQSSLGSNRGWTAGAASSAMDVDAISPQSQGVGAQGWSRWGVASSAGVAAH